MRKELTEQEEMYTHLSDSDGLKRRTRKGEKGLGEIASGVARSTEGINMPGRSPSLSAIILAAAKSSIEEPKLRGYTTRCK